jgi:signal transduction histidine kinase/ActR/RegA family two-component response regulator
MRPDEGLARDVSVRCLIERMPLQPLDLAQRSLMVRSQKDALMRQPRRRSPRTPVDLWIRIGFTLLFVVMSCVAFAAYRNATTFIRAGHSVAHTREVSEALKDLLDGTLDVESGTRGFIITGDVAFLEAIRAGRDKASVALWDVRGLVADNPVQSERLEALEPLVRNKLAWSQSVVETRRRRGFETAARDVQSRIAKEQQDDIRRHIAAMMYEEQYQLRHRVDTWNRTAQQTLLAVLGLVLGAAALLFAVYLLVRRDLSERRRGAAELLAARDQLEERVRARTAELAAANDSLINEVLERRTAEEALRRSEEQLRQSQKMEAVGRLAGGVAHDFNNLLTAILGFSQLMKRRLSPADSAWRETEEIEKAAQRAIDLTRQLLAFSRQQVLQPVVLDLNQVVAETEQMLRRLIGADIDLLYAPSANLGRVKADPGQLEQVILNLAVNARDAMPQGGDLTIETANVVLDTDSIRGRTDLSPGPYVLLAVSDTGTGMDETTQGRIFEPFFTTKEVDKGTGLGLSTVHGIIKQSGGHVEVYSEVGHGTTFKIYLPEVSDPLHTVERKPFELWAARGTETILVVEDEDQVRAVVRDMLELHGYTVIEASDAAEAFATCELEDLTLDLVLTDVVMPIMSGPDLSKHIALLRPNMRFLFMSGYTDRAVTHHGILGPDEPFLQKPFTVEALLQRVREVLDDRAAAA